MQNTNKLSLIALAVLASLPSLATADEDVSLDEVVVTATGFAQDIKEAPASISVVSNKEMKRMPMRDVGDAVSSEPGIEVSKTKSGSSQISIRGFDPQYTAILVDGKRQNAAVGLSGGGFDPNAAFMPNIDQVERVEVIRGPASVIYGSDAIGGVVNIITKKNFDKFQASVTVDALIQEDNDQYGNAFSQNLRVNIPLIENKLSMSVHGRNYTKDESNLRKPNGSYAGRSSGDYQNYTYGGVINYQITDKQRVYFDIDNAADSGIVNNTSNESLRMKQEWSRLKYSLNYDGSFENADVNTSLSYITTEQSGAGQSGRNGTGPIVDKPYDKLESEFYIAKASAITRHDTSFGFLSLNTGFEFMQERFYNDKSERLKNSYAKQSNVALYEEAEYFVTDNLITTLGLRASHSTIYGLALAPRAYLVYKASDALTLKTGVATGYKMGSLDQMLEGKLKTSTSNGGTWPYFGNPDLKEEKSVNYEVSAIYDTKGFGSFNITGFYTDFKNKIETQRFEIGEVFNGNKCDAKNGNDAKTTGYCLAYDNVAKSHVYGIEATYKSPIFYNMNLDVNYTFTKSKVDEGNASKIGKPVSETPRHAVFAKLNYVNNNFSSYLKATAKFDTPLTSVSGTQSPFYEDYVLFDLGMSYQFNKNHTVSFVVSNLFDKDFSTFYPYEYSRGGKVHTNYASEYSDYIEGRNYYLSYNYSF